LGVPNNGSTEPQKKMRQYLNPFLEQDRAQFRYNSNCQGVLQSYCNIDPKYWVKGKVVKFHRGRAAVMGKPMNGTPLSHKATAKAGRRAISETLKAGKPPLTIQCRLRASGHACVLYKAHIVIPILLAA